MLSQHHIEEFLQQKAKFKDPAVKVCPCAGVWEKQAGTRANKKDKQVTDSPRRQPWCLQLARGYDHVQFERTHPRPTDTVI